MSLRLNFYLLSTAERMERVVSLETESGTDMPHEDPLPVKRCPGDMSLLLGYHAEAASRQQRADELENLRLRLGDGTPTAEPQRACQLDHC